MTLFNVSSVSIPFDGQTLAAYAIAQWHEGFWSFRRYRVGYDLEPELKRLRQRKTPRPPWLAV